MRVDLDVKRLIENIDGSIDLFADFSDLSNKRFTDKDGREVLYLNLCGFPLWTIFSYLTKDGGKELYNELFVKDDAIMNAFKSFAEEYGYAGATVKLQERDCFVIPRLGLYKNIDINKK